MDLSVFPTGDKNDAFAKYFVGQSYLNMLSTEQVSIGNVTFELGCRNNWHIHHADKGGGSAGREQQDGVVRACLGRGLRKTEIGK